MFLLRINFVSMSISKSYLLASTGLNRLSPKPNAHTS